MSFTVDPQTYLDAISTYVSAQANVPTSATWETYSEPNSEVVSFRLADRSKVPFVGYVVTMDAAEVALTSKASIAQLVGDRINRASPFL